MCDSYFQMKHDSSSMHIRAAEFVTNMLVNFIHRIRKFNLKFHVVVEKYSYCSMTR